MDYRPTTNGWTISASAAKCNYEPRKVVMSRCSVTRCCQCLHRINKHFYRYSLFCVIALLLITKSTTQVAKDDSKIVSFRAKEKQILDQIMSPERYDIRLRPEGINSTGDIDGPCQVNVNIYLRSISRIDDLNMEFSTQLTLRQEWHDNRLIYDDIGGKIKSITLTDLERLWKPDLFFSNEKEGQFHRIIVPNVLVRIYPNGKVLFSIRISLKLACPMDLRLFPMDRQGCNIQMVSYGYTTEDLIFKWKQVMPVEMKSPFHLPRFTLETYYTEVCDSITTTGTYTCLKVILLFKREFSYYLIQIYIPGCMLVIVSWVSFWLDPNASPARVTLGVTTLLTMATQTSGINASLPPVSYTKAIDIWTGVCLTFVFGALLEYALVNYASRGDKFRERVRGQRCQWEVNHSAPEPNYHQNEDGTASHYNAAKALMHRQNTGVDMACPQHGYYCDQYQQQSQPGQKNTFKQRISMWFKARLSKFPSRSKRIDVLSRIIFPLIFAFFNLIYWTAYLFKEDTPNAG